MSSWPTELRLSKDRRTLHVAFEDGAQFALPAELLRVESPSAEVQGHHPSQKTIVPGKAEVEISLNDAKTPPPAAAVAAPADKVTVPTAAGNAP